MVKSRLYANFDHFLNSKLKIDFIFEIFIIDLDSFN